MLYHVPDVARALVETHRVLRPDGVFLASTNSLRSAPQLTGPWSEAMTAAGGPPLVRNSHRFFSLENGTELLAQVFPSVEVKVVTSTSLVPNARIVRDYVASTEDLYAPMMPTAGAWSHVLDAVESYAAGVIEQEGTFPVTATIGICIFICRGIS
jgi:SAM-dependent methyltransferase